MSEKTVVIFRVWNKDVAAPGSVIALFPELPSDGAGLYCLSYEHMGQHGAADYDSVMARSRPALEAEYAPLKRELEGRGYDLVVRQRITPQMREARRRAIREWQDRAG